MPTSFIVGAVLLSIVCGLIIVWPITRMATPAKRFVMPLLFAVVTLFGAYYFYSQNSQWNWHPSGLSDNPAAQKLYSLQEAVHDKANDHQAWLELGQFYLQFEQLAPAQEALNRSVQLSGGGNIEINLTLVEALSASPNTLDSPRIEELINTSLRINPDHRKALWYGGEIAASLQKYDVAIARWSRLLGESQKLNTPEAQSVTQLLSERIASAQKLLSAPSGVESVVVNATLDESKVGQLSGDTPVFVLARAQGQAGPPLAVHRTTVSALPLTVTLSDRNAMLPTRKISDFDEIEVVVRIALGGTPTAQSGDFFGLAQIGPDSERAVTIEVNQKQP